MRTTPLLFAAALTTLSTAALATTALAAPPAAPTAAAQSKPPPNPISPARLSADVKVLADAKLYGRAPGGPGEAGTLAYLEGQFKALGLKPAGDPVGGKPGWTQAVPLIRFTVQPDPKFSLTAGGKTQALAETKQIMAWTQRPTDRVKFENAPLVFVGYGAPARGRGWEDFKGVDMKGKIAVILINAPAFEAEPGEPVAGKFGGK